VVKTLFRIQGVSGDLLPIIGWRNQPLESAVIVSKQPLPTLPGVAIAPAMFLSTTNDFPQFMGPRRDATVSGPTLARDWQAQPPQLLWRQAVGPAWSGFAIVGNAAVTQEQRGDSELVVCYDVPTGKLIWSHADAAHYHTTLAGEGPRATPTITSNRVYTLGASAGLTGLPPRWYRRASP
jgi:outer membrane protein assembly factor BamB